MDDSPSRVALAYGFLGSNLGDVAITKGALAALRAAGIGGPIKVISRGLNTRLTRSSWQRVLASDPAIESQPWDHTFASFRNDRPPTVEFVRSLLGSREVRSAILRACGLASVERLYYSGGENLFSYGTPNDDWNLFGRLSVLLAARAEGLRTGFLPCTFGPFESEVSRHLIAEALAGADFVMVRDAYSSREIPNGAAPVLGADGAFFTPNALASTNPPSRWGKRIALVPRLEGSGLRPGPDRSQAYLAAVGEKGIESSAAFQLYLDIGRRLLSSGRFLRLLTQCDADVELNRALFDALTPHAKTDNQISLSRPPNLSAYHRVLATCGGVVTSRLHTAIFGLQNGVVPIALYHAAHGHKTPGVYALLGLDEFCHPAEGFAAEQVIPMLAEARRAAPRVPALLDSLRAQTIETIRTADGIHGPRVEIAGAEVFNP